MLVKDKVIINVSMDITYSDTIHYIIDLLNDTKDIINIYFEDPIEYAVDVDMASKVVKFNDIYYNLVDTPIVLFSYDTETDDVTITPYTKTKYEIFPQIKFRNQIGFIFYDRSDDSIYSIASNRLIYPKILNMKFNYLNIGSYTIFDENVNFDRWDQIILYLQERFTEYVNIKINPDLYDIYIDTKTMYRLATYSNGVLPINRKADIFIKTKNTVDITFNISMTTFKLSPELYYISFNKENTYELSEFSDENGDITITIDDNIKDIYIIPKQLKRIYVLNTVQRLNDITHLNIIRT